MEYLHKRKTSTSLFMPIRICAENKNKTLKKDWEIFIDIFWDTKKKITIHFHLKQIHDFCKQA